MKYLLDFLGGIPDAPNLSDPEFQQLLVDVQAGKSQTKANETFYENLEKVLNELKSTPDSGAFHKPVSKREAPNYYDIITKPMDFATMSKNVKMQRYKTKAEFGADLDLIWENCLFFNTQENHPLRAVARMMKQKADHHLSFVAERTDKSAMTFINSLSTRRPSVEPSTGMNGSTSQREHRSGPATHSVSGHATNGVGGGIPEEEDATGEVDDAAGGRNKDGDSDFRNGVKGTMKLSPLGDNRDGQVASLPQESLGGHESSRGRRGTSVATNGHRPNGHASSSRQSPPPFRPKLQTTFDNVPSLTRTPHSTTQFHNLSLNQPGPSFSDKGKAKEVLQPFAPPSWYAASAPESEDSKLEGAWWSYVQKDESYTAGLPAVPQMCAPAGRKRARPAIHADPRRRRSVSTSANGDSASTLVDHTPPKFSKLVYPTTNTDTNSSATLTDATPQLLSSRPKPINLTNVIHRSADRLFDIRRSVTKIHEFQKAENEGIPPPVFKPHIEREERRQERQEWHERKRRRKDERIEARKRGKLGGEVGEKEAALNMRMATAGMLAQAGFEGANDTAMDLMSRVVMDRITNLGRTLRLLIDGFSNQMTSEEMVLHALYENGGLGPAAIESHIKDEIEREDSKIGEMSRRMRQAYKEVTTAPVIEDDMMFADSGEMLLDGNFADELGEDFLGLRDLGVAQEHGMQNLTIPTSVFYGRKKRHQDHFGLGPKEEGPEYPPPPPFVPLSATTYQTQLPALFHSFFASRIDSGQGLADDVFDAPHSQIGSLGQIVIKNPPAMKKRPEIKKKEKLVKVVVPGPGKGNWVRPPKEERDRKAAEKKAYIARRSANGSDDDAEGEEE